MAPPYFKSRTTIKGYYANCSIILHLFTLSNYANSLGNGNGFNDKGVKSFLPIQFDCDVHNTKSKAKDN